MPGPPAGTYGPHPPVPYPGQPAPPAGYPPAYGEPPGYGEPPPYGEPTGYGEPPGYGEPTGYGEPPGYGQRPGYGEPAYPPAYGDPGFAPGPYDTAVTEVFDIGRPSADPYADAHTAPIRMPPSVDMGPRGFGPPAGFGPPPPAGFGPPPSAGFDVTSADGFGGPSPKADPDAPLFSRLRRIRSHAKQRRSRKWVGVLIAVVLVATTAALRFYPDSPWYYGGEEEGGAPSQVMPFHPAEFTTADLATEGFLSWAYQDLRDGTVVGSSNMTETSDAGPMITAWFGADLLRRSAETGQRPPDTELADVEVMIRDEDLAAAERVVTSLNGAEESVGRLRTMCQLSDVTPVAGPWQDAAISAEDAAKMGGCLADGRAAGAEWTPWLLNVMRQVNSDFGIRDAFPAGDRPVIAVANGVVLKEADGQWRANCLAVGPTWSLAVLQRFPSSGDANSDLAHGDTVCQKVVGQLTSSP
jgi:hypothetical protein